jgi:RNA polymerase sigma factor (sigma-70 family)
LSADALALGFPEELEAWFKRTVLCHEQSLTRFLSRRWPCRHELPDLRQEAYARVYEAALKAKPRSPKAYLLTTARHLMADKARRDQAVAFHSRSDQAFHDLLIDENSPERQITGEAEVLHMARAFDQLSPRMREVLWLRRVEEYSQREVAERLGISEKTVEKHLHNGSRQLADLLRP